jgi:hypothetical protein
MTRGSMGVGSLHGLDPVGSQVAPPSRLLNTPRPTVPANRCLRFVGSATILRSHVLPLFTLRHTCVRWARTIVLAYATSGRPGAMANWEGTRLSRRPAALQLRPPSTVVRRPSAVLAYIAARSSGVNHSDLMSAAARRGTNGVQPVCVRALSKYPDFVRAMTPPERSDSMSSTRMPQTRPRRQRAATCSRHRWC